MRAVPGILTLSLLVVVVWGQCAGCLHFTVTHDCCEQTNQPSCHVPEPSQAHDCSCPDAGLLLEAAKPEPGITIATPALEEAPRTLAEAQVHFVASVLSGSELPAVRAVPGDLYLLNRVLLI